MEGDGNLLARLFENLLNNAVKYGKDDRLATKIVVFSTVVSLITLPVWCYILTV